MAPGRFGGEAALSVEARYLEPELPIELDDAYRQTFDRLRRMFRARGCTPEEAADLAQDAAIRAFVHIRRWGVASGGLHPLLNRIARNLLIDRYRRTTPHLVPLDSARDLHDPDQDPTEEVARRQRRRAVHHAIRELPSRHQSAIKYSLSGMTPEEVGKQLGIGRNAADALLHRARRSLKEHLAPVRDGMWGLALAMRIRYDRVMRRAGVDSFGADSGAALISQSAGLAAVIIVTTLGLAAGGAAFSPATHVRSAVSVHGVENGGGLSTTGISGNTGGSAGEGSISGGGSDMHGGSLNLGAASAGGSWGERRMNAHATVPGNNPEKSPLLGLGLDSYPDAGNDYEGPGANLVNPLLRVACANTALKCGGSS